MFEALALLGGFWFFLFVIFILAAGILCAEFNNFFGAGATLVGLAAGSQFLFGIPVWSSIIENPFLVIVGIVAYAAIGMFYAIVFRYADYLRKNKHNIRAAWGDFQVSYKKGHGEDSNPTREEFRKSLQYRDFTPSYNSEKITAWVMMWPWAVFWDLCHKPVRWVYNNMYSFAGRMLDAVGARISDKILNEKEK